VTPTYFATMGIPLRDGRDVAPTDTRDTPPVAVVSESFAKRYWPNQRVIGKRFKIQMAERTIIGVAGDVRVRGLEVSSEPQVYLASAQMSDSDFYFYSPQNLAVRASAPTASLLPAIRQIVRAADAEQPISGVRTMREIVDDETASRVTQLRLLGLLSAIALLIAGVGIHGLLTFTVARRTQEIGVRRALGEQVGSVVRRVLGEGLVLAAFGTLIGIVVAYFGARAMGALLAGVRPGDPITMGIAAVLCFATAAVGCIRPALKAARVDPIMALRGEV
jgi:putative ABC transport system permease protein